MRDSRWRAIAEGYRAEIESGRLAPGAQLPSSEAIAERTGVSRLTAHKAVEELQRLGLVVRDGRRGTRVLPRRRPTTRRIALILDQVDYEHGFPRPELLAGVHEGLGTDYELVLCDAKANPAREIDLIRRMADETDGILCWPSDKSEAATALNEVVARGVPLVLLDRVPRGAEAHAVVGDGGDATRQAVEFLLARGHRRIGLLTFDKPGVSTVVERCETFETVLAERDCAASDLIRRLPSSLEVSERDHLESAVGDALFRLVRSPQSATAVFCVQDLLGYAVLEAAADMDLAIPGDVEVVTFNDWPPSWLRRPWQAHRIAFQPGEMGRAAIGLLRSQIEGTAGAPSVQRIPAKLVPAEGVLATFPDSFPLSANEG